LAVWKLDRLARSLKDLVEIVQDLHDRNIGFKSLTESIDTTSSGGRLVFRIFGALAEFEHDLIQERTIVGLQAARARGRKGGRKPALSNSDIRKAVAMLSDPKITKTETAIHFGVTSTTLNASLKRLGLADLPRFCVIIIS
jgi:DNA invertase Pin-like site-specific DNA recombinase